MTPALPIDDSAYVPPRAIPRSSLDWAHERRRETLATRAALVEALNADADGLTVPNLAAAVGRRHDWTLRQLLELETQGLAGPVPRDRRPRSALWLPGFAHAEVAPIVDILCERLDGASIGDILDATPLDHITVAARLYALKRKRLVGTVVFGLGLDTRWFLRPQPASGLSPRPAGAEVLAVVAANPHGLTTVQLERTLDCARSYLERMLRLLCRGGHVTSEPSPLQGRRWFPA